MIGGFCNTASGQDSFIGSSRMNSVLADYSSTSGGRDNTVNGSLSVVAAAVPRNARTAFRNAFPANAGAL